MTNRLSTDFYLREDVVQIAQDLLGKIIVTEFEGVQTAGIIAETEAYRAPEDKASHAYGNKITPRTQTMFEAGGIAYVYLCYGIHHLFNVVTGPAGMAHAVLIRAVFPYQNTQKMLERRQMSKVSPKIAAGPGTLTQALGISTRHNAVSFTAENTPMWLEDAGYRFTKEQILAGPRIGVDYAAECAAWPWRFWIKSCSVPV